ncbi:MAG: DEAD/DEAH box helicase [Halioglobus sp.]
MSSENPVTSFSQLNLPATVQKALDEVGYETPSAIQAQTIPHMLEGADLLGQAQTGTGKTAAFAVPILARLDLKQKTPQVLVLAPTRELAIQVAEAFQKYAKHIPGFRVLPVYGGSDYRGQQRQLERGVHIVVGTPGRVMDHMRRKTMDLSKLKTLVLDEADEMLRMGFIDDVEWILDQTPDGRQIALFSATMPAVIRRIAQKYLTEPREVTIKMKTVTNESIRQRVWMMAGSSKLDALTRILEVEDFDAMIVFVRTRIATTELSDKLAARGYACAAINGDIAQKLREKTIENLKSGKLDILVATDVAARGLDVTRISHVINYDIPYDVEAYIHRIGRTGRAGRQGDAILFAANRERRLLGAIEKATGKKIEKMQLPTAEEVTDKRLGKFKQRITEVLDTRKLEVYRKLVDDYQHEYGVPVVEIAAALAALAEGKSSLSTPVPAAKRGADKKSSSDRKKTPASEKMSSSEKFLLTAGKSESRKSSVSEEPPRRKKIEVPAPEKDMQRYRLEVGLEHGVKPGNIVGAIANEAELDSEYIGRIEIYDDYSTVDLPEGMPKELFKHLKKVRVSGQRLDISKIGKDSKVFEDAKNSARKERKPGKSKKSASSKKPAAKKPVSKKPTSTKPASKKSGDSSVAKPRKRKVKKDSES